MNPTNFFAELKRRNVYKVAVAYAVVGWLLVQVTTQVFPIFEIPNWALRLIVLAIIIGFPIALVIAWAFELTPEGLKRTEDVGPTIEARKNKTRLGLYRTGFARWLDCTRVSLSADIRAEHFQQSLFSEVARLR